MRPPVLFASLLLVASAVAPGRAQQPALDRLPRAVLDVSPPSARVRGNPGTMSVQTRPCPELPIASARRRVVDVAIQEWAFFGFRVTDQTVPVVRPQPQPGGAPDGRGGFRRRPRMAPEEAGRVASSIAGYWAVTPEGAWIVSRQNDEWNGPDGIGARWNAPWSAAFISWVMCEAGLGNTAQFRRAIAHHSYIDQAIRARDGRDARAAFVAYDTGETAIVPGDLLCSSRQPVYRTLAERRRQMGGGARTHCDIVVKVDEASERILAIGGNVRGVVSLKLLRGQRTAGKPFTVVDPDEDARPIFAHLELRAEPIGADALSTSAPMQAFACALSGSSQPLAAAARATSMALAAARC